MQGSLFRRKPLADDFDPGGVVARFAHAKKKSKYSQADRAARECVKHLGRRPPGDCQRIPNLGAEPVEERPRDPIHHGISQHERENNVAVGRG